MKIPQGETPPTVGVSPDPWILACFLCNKPTSISGARPPVFNEDNCSCVRPHRPPTTEGLILVPDTISSLSPSGVSLDPARTEAPDLSDQEPNGLLDSILALAELLGLPLNAASPKNIRDTRQETSYQLAQFLTDSGDEMLGQHAGFWLVPSTNAVQSSESINSHDAQMGSSIESVMHEIKQESINQLTRREEETLLRGNLLENMQICQAGAWAGEGNPKPSTRSSKHSKS